MKKKVKNGMAGEPIEEYRQPLTFESVWQLFRETDKKFQETDRQFKETDKKLSEIFQEFARSYEENKQMLRESEKRMKKLDELFTSQWGKLMESLVRGDLVRLLRERQVPVQRTTQRQSGNYQGTSYEYDIIAINGEEIVIVEVKTTLRPSDVKHFISKLARAKTWLHEYRNKTIYGAMAFLQADSGSEKMAESKGLFVIRATGSSASIINLPDFKPKTF